MTKGKPAIQYVVVRFRRCTQMISNKVYEKKRKNSVNRNMLFAIALACVGGVFAILGIIPYDKIIEEHSGDDAWLKTEEYQYCNLMQQAHSIQLIHTFGTAICAVALLTAILCWARLRYDTAFTKLTPMPYSGNGPQFMEYRFMNKKLLIFQFIFEPICIGMGIALYFVIQYATFCYDMLTLFGVLMILEFISMPLSALNVLALGLQYSNRTSALYKSKL